jgi:uncharacterized protein
MKVVVFGASGRVGKLLVEQALHRGYQVTAFVRSENRMPFTHERLSIIQGDARREDEVSKAIAGQDAVMVALGDFRPDGPVNLMSEATKHILWAMNQHGVSRIIGICGAGILQKDEVSLQKNTTTFPSYLRYVSEDHLRVFTRYQSTGLHWTFVCPPYMPDGGATGSYRLRMNYNPAGGIAVRTGDVAHFMLKELEENRFVRTRVGIAY